MKPFNLFLIGALILIGTGFFFLKESLLETPKSGSISPTSAEVSANRPNYLDYSAQNLKRAQEKGGAVLFFAALKWCPTCIQLDKEINERYQELPQDLTILRVDYDNDKSTKAKHQVTTQHTLIQLDRNGQEVNRWIGGNFDAFLQNLK